MASPEPEHVDLDALVTAARAMITAGERRVLGITGAPGSGKSTLAGRLVDALADEAVLVGLDGFHLADVVLNDLGIHPRKGAADTFDAAGYVALLRRLRRREEAVVYAPVFDRALEDSIAGAVAVPREVPLVITEGNYLLVDDDRWGAVSGLLDACWFVAPGEQVRLERLIARHERFGRGPLEARERSLGPDQRNAELIEATRSRATRVLRVAVDGERTRPS